ncbi:hypothetical protein CMO91_05230 [Candidatus Woesearchaeota archaeon]|nr:hypothetical protein [Candidatus Woesearchaeota archaeon]
MRWGIPALCAIVAAGSGSCPSESTAEPVAETSLAEKAPTSVLSFKSEHGRLVHAWGKDPFVVISPFTHPSTARAVKVQNPLHVLDRLGPICDELYDTHGVRVLIPEGLSATVAEKVERGEMSLGIKGPRDEGTDKFVAAFHDILTRRKWDLIGRNINTQYFTRQLRTITTAFYKKAEALIAPVDYRTTAEQQRKISNEIIEASEFSNRRILALFNSKEGKDYVDIVLNKEEQAYVDAAAPHIEKGEPVLIMPGNGHPQGIAEKCKKAGLSYAIIQPKGLKTSFEDDRKSDFVKEWLITDLSFPHMYKQADGTSRKVLVKIGD